MYGFKQSLIVTGLSEECKRATLKRLSTGRWVVVSRYEDDQDSAAMCGELFLQFKAVRPAQTRSRIRRSGVLSRQDRRNSSAEGKVSDSKPADMTSLPMARRTAFSSSTMATNLRFSTVLVPPQCSFLHSARSSTVLIL